MRACRSSDTMDLLLLLLRPLFPFEKSVSSASLHRMLSTHSTALARTLQQYRDHHSFSTSRTGNLHTAHKETNFSTPKATKFDMRVLRAAGPADPLDAVCCNMWHPPQETWNPADALTATQLKRTTEIVTLKGLHTRPNYPLPPSSLAANNAARERACVRH
ncbi:unnamed protein product [Ectocarpus fasciculatus]